MSPRRVVSERDHKVIDAALSGQPLHLVLTRDGKLEAEEVAEAVQADDEAAEEPG